MEKGIVYIAPSRRDQWLAALQRGRRELIRTWLTARGWRARAHRPWGKGPYTLQAVQLKGDEAGITCSCRGWGYKGYCKHAAVLAVRLARQGHLVRLDYAFPSSVERNEANDSCLYKVM